MSTCKFYKVGEEWLYKVRPGFDEGQPVTKEILLQMLGTTGLYKAIVTVSNENNRDLDVTIEDGVITEARIENLRFIPVDLAEFVVRVPETDHC